MLRTCNDFFTNFYRCFILGFSWIAHPIMCMLWGNPKCLIWNSAAEQVLILLKTAFTTSPTLKHSDPSKSFNMNVDTSETGVCAILSQRFGDKPKLFISNKLSSAEQNYDIENREIKLALEECWHWLKGAEHPFIIYTNLKNLEYLHSTKCLNPQQACWSLQRQTLCPPFMPLNPGLTKRNACSLPLVSWACLNGSGHRQHSLRTNPSFMPV